MNPDQGPQDFDKPIAYDAEGRPLYAAPPQPQPTPSGTDHAVVHMARATEPVKPTISAELRQKHEESMRAFPGLNISEGEFVISAIRRHPIGLFVPAAITGILVAIIVAGLANFEHIMTLMDLPEVPDFGPTLLVGVLAILLVLAGGYIAIWVYLSNRFFLTNESVIQEVQQTLFSRLEQTVSLSNIEDASYTQTGLLQTMLNYGSIRLSTEGDETTYRFTYVYNPREEIATLNNAVEAFKNGRPVGD